MNLYERKPTKLELILKIQYGWKAIMTISKTIIPSIPITYCMTVNGDTLDLNFTKSTGIYENMFTSSRIDIIRNIEKVLSNTRQNKLYKNKRIKVFINSSKIVIEKEGEEIIDRLIPLFFGKEYNAYRDVRIQDFYKSNNDSRPAWILTSIDERVDGLYGAPRLFRQVVKKLKELGVLYTTNGQWMIMLHSEDDLNLARLTISALNDEKLWHIYDVSEWNKGITKIREYLESRISFVQHPEYKESNG